jgi:hypothetical protein
MGAKKYEPRNWEKGMDFTRLLGAMKRHIAAWERGEKFDQQDGQLHLASVMCCAMFLMELEETHPEFDDRVKWDPGDRPLEDRANTADS